MADQSRINKTTVVIALLILSLVPHTQNYNSQEYFLFDLYFILMFYVWQSAEKTTISLLQELYVKKDINPKYDLIQIEGAIHGPTFKYWVSVGDLVGKSSNFDPYILKACHKIESFLYNYGFRSVKKEGKTCCSQGSLGQNLGQPMPKIYG